MPIDYRKYPDNWKTEIRPAILERAGGCCEFCGVRNYTWIYRHVEYPELYMELLPGGGGAVDQSGNLVDGNSTEYSNQPIRVVLTVAHLDHDITNNDYDNLRALCQRCHLTHDAQDNARRAAITRGRNRE